MSFIGKEKAREQFDENDGVVLDEPITRHKQKDPSILKCKICEIPLHAREYSLRCKSENCWHQHSLIGSDGIHCASCLGEDDRVSPEGKDIPPKYKWEELRD